MQSRKPFVLEVYPNYWATLVPERGAEKTSLTQEEQQALSAIRNMGLAVRLTYSDGKPCVNQELLDEVILRARSNFDSAAYNGARLLGQLGFKVEIRACMALIGSGDASKAA